MDISLEVQDRLLRIGLLQLIGLAKNPEPIMHDMAAIGEASTRLRFRTETGPDGQRWKTSLRARLVGGRTLTQDGHLSGSISSRYSEHDAEWGVNRIYAALMQFGGVIRAVRAKVLRFRLPGGRWVSLREVRIPARPYLGISDDDGQDMLHAVRVRIQEAANGR